MFLTLSSLAMGAPCDPVPSRVEAETAIAEARLDDAMTAWRAAVDSLSCTEVAADELARLYLVQGAVLLLRDRDPAGAAFAFRAARDVDDTVAPALGPAVAAGWASVTPERAAEVTVTLAGVPPEWSTLVDAQVVTGPLSMPAGLHLLQVRDPARGVRWGSLQLVESPVTLQLPAFSTVDAPAVAQERHPARAALRVAGLSAVGLGGLGVALSLPPRSAQSDASDLATLRALRDRQVGFASSGLAVAGVGVVLIGASFAF